MNYRGLIWAGVYVQDLDASVSFYRDVLSLRLLERGDGWAYFDAGGGALVELFIGGSAQRAPKTPDQQSIILGLRVENLDRAVAELSAKGVQFLPEDSGEAGGERWAHFYDGEGNRLEVKEVP
jgi:catechol 2,3-dioxygenase-like lactoylglutathione lyase family enzyme